jgi:hypothetical protein
VSTKRLYEEENAVEKFLSRYRSHVTGVLSGFDRLVFHGILQPLIRKLGMYHFLKDSGVQLIDFKDFAVETTERIKRAALDEAERLNRPVRYLPSARQSKEELAREILERDPVEQGLICLFTTVEPCTTFSYVRSKDQRERGLKPTSSKCLHLYKYFIHPVFGFMSARLQSWFPFNVQICMNGREWLARQLLDAGHPHFKRARNCFPWIKDFPLAQRLMNEQLKTNWPRALTQVARTLNPIHDEIFRCAPMDYYWSAHQTEWATDLAFQSPSALAGIYPQLVRFAMLHFRSPDVMRFLADKAPGNFTGQIVTSFKHRAEGVRVKHWLRGNSIKMYDKAGSVLRIETTIGQTDDFKVFRPKTNGAPDQFEWLPLRKGVADLHRRAQVSDRSNTVYLDALSTTEDTTPCSKIFDAVSRPTADSQGRRVRALRLNDPDELALLEATSRGEFSTSGFRNRDIRRQLYGRPFSPEETRRLSARTGRLLRILRAHGLLIKVPKTTRYRLSAQGQLLTTTLFATRNADVRSLLKTAA